MTEENLGRASQLSDRKATAEACLEKIKDLSGPTSVYVHGDFDSSCTVDIRRFAVFLKGEIQALNLELHHLGVELPGVPTIGEKQSLTKGNDI